MSSDLESIGRKPILEPILEPVLSPMLGDPQEGPITAFWLDNGTGAISDPWDDNEIWSE